MRKTFKYKIIPLGSTAAKAMHWLELCRHLYNCALEHRIMNWRDRRFVSYYDQQNELPELKKQHTEYTGVSSAVLQDVLRRLDRTYKNFFRSLPFNKPAFPRFKSKPRYRSFTFSGLNSFRVDSDCLSCSKLGQFKLRLHRPIEGELKTCTIVLYPSGEWFACFSCDAVPKNLLLRTGRSVGIDLGLSNFAVDSNGLVTKPPKFFRAREKYLRRCLRSLSRKKKDGKNREKARIKVAKAHQKVVNQRNDFLHKLALQYVRNYDEISIEDLSVSKMIRNKNLSKSFGDAALRNFIAILSFKAENAGKTIYKKDPSGTTSNCRLCGTYNKLSLRDRVFKCRACGHYENRDLHAAINIKNKPVRAISLEHNAKLVELRVQKV